MNKKALYVVIAVVIIVVIGGAWWLTQSKNNSALNSYSTDQNTTPSTDTNTGSTMPSVVQGKLSYEAALALYGDNRIQFDSKCLATPTFPTFKIGTRIMLDNRSGKKAVISLDGTDYAIGAYGYTVVTLRTSASLPHTVYVDCNNGENNARILLQK